MIATAQLMLVLDDTIVNVALASMQRSLQLATSHLNWVIGFYALAFGGLLLAGGRAGDLSLLATTFPAGPARTKALGVYGATGGLGSVVGLLLAFAFRRTPRGWRITSLAGTPTWLLNQPPR